MERERGTVSDLNEMPQAIAANLGVHVKMREFDEGLHGFVQSHSAADRVKRE